MQRAMFFGSGTLLVALWLLSGAAGFRPSGTRAEDPAAAAGARIARAAQAFLGALSEEERSLATFAAGDPERTNWHFIPRERKGLSLRTMDDEEKKLVERLLRASLSEAGVKTVEDVRGLEAVLAEIEGPNRRFPRDPELYFASVFGTPAPEGRWGWRFEGHHLSLNFTLDGHRLVSATPLFFGANPAEVRSGPKQGLRVLAGVEDIARELMKSLRPEQRAVAIGEGKPEEVGGTQKITYDGDLPPGLTAEKLDSEQKRILERLVDEYLRHLDPATRARLRKEILGADLGKVHIAWRGSTDPYEGHSYMVHGPEFIIAYANFQNGARHVHSGFRATREDFGAGGAKD